MKHLFVVHSNITYLSALGIIKHDNLNLDDCVLMGWNYIRAEPVPVVRIATFDGLAKCKFNLRRYLCPSAIIDKRLCELSGNEPFTLYVSVVEKLARHAMTHPLCSCYHFFEEGMSAYCSTFSLSTLTAHNGYTTFRPKGIMARIKDIKLPLRGYSSRLNAIPIHYNAHSSDSRKYYGFSEYSHICAPARCRVVMDMRSIVNRFELQPKYKLDNETVWIGNCIADDSFDAYFAAIEAIFIKEVLVKSAIKRIYVKFHYRDPSFNRERALALFNKYGIEVTVIEDSAIMEVELMFSHSMNLYGTNSTLLFYGGILDHKSYSVERLYQNGSIDKAMPIFWKYVNKL